MEWYKIVTGIVAWILGVWLWCKISDYNKYKYHNRTFKEDLKKRKK